MKMLFAVSFLMCISVVFGLKCYECSSQKSMSHCDNFRRVTNCSHVRASCFKETLNYKVGDFRYRSFYKGCTTTEVCYSALGYQLCKAADDGDCVLTCCEGDHCNTGTAPSVSVLLLVTCALVFFFC